MCCPRLSACEFDWRVGLGESSTTHRLPCQRMRWPRQPEVPPWSTPSSGPGRVRHAWTTTSRHTAVMSSPPITTSFGGCVLFSFLFLKRLLDSPLYQMLRYFYYRIRYFYYDIFNVEYSICYNYIGYFYTVTSLISDILIPWLISESLIATSLIYMRRSWRVEF